MMENYFRRQNKANLLSQGKAKVLEDKVRQEIVHCIVEFMIEAFGCAETLIFSKQQKTLTARAAVCLFEGLKSNDRKNELVMKLKNSLFILNMNNILIYSYSFIQSKLIGYNGFLISRIKYLKSKKSKHLNRQSVANAQITEEITDRMSAVTLSPEDDLKFLKTSVIKHTEKGIILAKLKNTQKLRDQMMHDENIDLRTSFPFFFADPDLVCIFK